MVDDNQLRAIRAMSHALFGAQYRLEIGAAVAKSDGLVCIVDLADLLGDPPGKVSVNSELKVLERAGLLARTDAGRSGRRVYLARQPSVYWNACVGLYEQAASVANRSVSHRA